MLCVDVTVWCICVCARVCVCVHEGVIGSLFLCLPATQLLHRLDRHKFCSRRQDGRSLPLSHRQGPGEREREREKERERTYHRV